MDKYAPEIIELILSGTAGKAVCAALGLCVLERKQLVTVGGTGGEKGERGREGEEKDGEEGGVKGGEQEMSGRGKVYDLF